MGKLHRERAVTRRIFQALPTQTDTTIALIYKMDIFNHFKLLMYSKY
jgi:hypothetical protein